jgi:hypothetical protein
MEGASAKVSEIQRGLGHISAATTSLYLQALRVDENPYAETIEQMLVESNRSSLDSAQHQATRT